MLIFTIVYVVKQNYEFISYIIVVLLMAAVIFASIKHITYKKSTLWLLSLWGLLHMVGGLLPIGDTVLYAWMVIPLSETLPILRADQVIHLFGFFAATLALHDVMQSKKWKFGVAYGIILMAAGMGLGALNEVIEFIVTLVVPSNGVGGYLNTGLDLVANFFGALFAIIFIKYKR
jgi:putative membrane protein